ncbi:MAG: TPM domain-containing protein [Proteobacteria bacterium]|nr:TPM domain-containing protein [Pseudomonadota bacterium]
MKYHTKSEKFFTKEEREKIKKATVDAELHTTGEIAVVMVNHSSQYIEAEVIGGIFLGSLISLVLTVVFFHSSIWVYIPLSFVLYFPSHVLFRKAPVLKVAFVGKRKMERAVKERAIRAFYEKGLYRTKDHTGVIFFLSLLERKVWVLADKGIHKKITQPTLNRFARTVSKGVREGRACDALCEAIQEIGGLLAKYYPGTAGDIDELTDEVIYDSGD